MIYFITGNDNKFLEVKSILRNIEPLKLDLSEVQSLDAKEIIQEKLKEAIKKHSGPFIVEDTSLYLDCMDGFPGPLIKWFLKSVGVEGIYHIVKSYDNFNAEAKTLIGYYNCGKMEFFEGIIKGKIVAPTGPTNFGWDSIFEPEGYQESFQQMAKEEKNKISMRTHAVKKLKSYLDHING